MGELCICFLLCSYIYLSFAAVPLLPLRKHWCLLELREIVIMDATLLNSTATQGNYALGLPQDTYWAQFDEVSKYNVSLNYFEKLWAARYIYMQNDVLATGIMSFVMHEAVYFGRSLPWIIIDRISYFNKWKLQGQKIPTVKEQWACTKLVLLSHFTVELPQIWLFHPMAVSCGMAVSFTSASSTRTFIRFTTNTLLLLVSLPSTPLLSKPWYSALEQSSSPSFSALSPVTSTS